MDDPEELQLALCALEHEAVGADEPCLQAPRSSETPRGVCGHEVMRGVGWVSGWLPGRMPAWLHAYLLLPGHPGCPAARPPGRLRDLLVITITIIIILLLLFSVIIIIIVSTTTIIIIPQRPPPRPSTP